MGHILVSNVGKAYKQYPSQWARLRDWFSPAGKKSHSLKWVLQNISFEILPGQALGIIGINGAGKSTLLKLITGTAHPTAGSIQMTGQVAALLELGMGFHPDFTGRQNVVMAGQLLGMSIKEIHACMPEIEAFAEIGEYIDQPVRTYSSGMQVRLAFSIATARRPDILIVDEALSVGDAYFQHKSFQRIREFRNAGTTLLIVSHDHTAIQSICDRALLLDKGGLLKDGTPEEVLDFYNALIAERENSNIDQRHTEDGRVQTTSGTGAATVAEITLLDTSGSPIETVNVGQQLTLRIRVDIYQPIPQLVLGYMIKDRLGQAIFGTNTHYTEKQVTDLNPGNRIEYCISFTANIGPGSYAITTALTGSETHLADNYEWRDLALLFTVVNLNQHHFVGTNWLPPHIEVTQ